MAVYICNEIEKTVRDQHVTQFIDRIQTRLMKCYVILLLELVSGLRRDLLNVLENVLVPNLYFLNLLNIKSFIIYELPLVNIILTYTAYSIISL